MDAVVLVIILLSYLYHSCVLLNFVSTANYLPQAASISVLFL